MLLTATARDHHPFFLSVNHVWLTDAVPWRYVIKVEFTDQPEGTG